MTNAFRQAPLKPTISLLDVEKIDIRVGEIVSVNEIKRARRLVCLNVDFGDHKRAIVAGLRGERADLTALIGVQTLFVVNLESRELHGVQSQGMLFDIGHADGMAPALALLEHSLPNGARAG